MDSFDTIISILPTEPDFSPGSFRFDSPGSLDSLVTFVNDERSDESTEGSPLPIDLDRGGWGNVYCVVI